MREFTAMDVFCGAGGLSLGLTKAGFRPVAAFDLDPWACETYRKNLGPHVHQTDIASLTTKILRDKWGIRAGALDLVCGGPPCQGFSIQRRGGAKDARNNLVVKFAQLSIDLHPALILMENVPTILGERGRVYFEQVQTLFENAGYRFEAGVLDAANYGVPQHRRRAVIAAWDPRLAAPVSLPLPTHDARTWNTVRDALSDCPEPPKDYTEHSEFANHTRVKVSRLNEERISHVPPGGGRADIPRRLQLPCHRNDNGHRHLDVYGRMEWGKPAPTITAMFDNFTRGRFAHPIRNRSITSREGARFQSFPDSFRFFGPKKDVARQIGNAVPPLLAKSIGSALRKALTGVDSKVVATVAG